MPEPVVEPDPVVEPEPEPMDNEIDFVDLTSVSYTNGCGNNQVQAGSTAEIEPGRAYDLTAYGHEMGFHCDRDHGQFAYVEVTGDFEFIAQVEYASSEDGLHHTRPGLMARELPAADNARFVGVTVTANYTADHFADLRNWAVRMDTGGNLFNKRFFYHVAQEDAPDHHSPLPFPRQFPDEWLRLKRTGNEFMAWYGSDGENWKEHRRFTDEFPQGPGTSWTIDLGETVAVGLSLEGSPEHSLTTKGTAHFRNVKLTVPEP